MFSIFYYLNQISFSWEFAMKRLWRNKLAKQFKKQIKQTNSLDLDENKQNQSYENR